MAWFSLVVAVLSVTLLFVWPGYLAITRCDSSRSPSEQINNRTYCYVIVSVRQVYPPSSPPNCTLTPYLYGSASILALWGFNFRLTPFLSCPEFWGGLNFTVTDPNGTSFHVVIPTVFPAPGVQPNRTWFAPDNESGIHVPPDWLNDTIFVKEGM